jgi:hypothetical protein
MVMSNNSVELATSMAAKVRAISLPNVFNPYSDQCSLHDHKESAAIRLRNLIDYFSNSFRTMPSTAWIGRDLGYRGGRRTGLPLTDEAHIGMFSSAYSASKAKKATKTSVVGERTASEIWRVIAMLDDPPFLWNAFPLHPHESGDSQNNRCHTRSEFAACEAILLELLSTFKFARIFALGGDASRALTRLNVEHICVRHPSYGGQTEFRRTMCENYGVEAGSKQLGIFDI